MDSARYQVDPFEQRASSCEISTTEYHGAGGLDDSASALRVEHNRFQDAQLTDTRTSPSAPVREGLGSRLLTTLSNAQPAAAALSRSGSVLHSRAKSWAAAYNNAVPERSPSPTKSKFIDNLFSGESGRVRLGVPTSPIKELPETEFVMEYRPGFTERPVRPRLRQQPTTTTVNTATSSTGRKTSWFTRKSTTPTIKVEDDMLNVNIKTALFPHGVDDPISPQTFNDLLLNATSLIERLQAAYKEKVDYLASIQPEIDAQKEEVEEAKTRSEHLKMQLEDTARIAQEQRTVNEELMVKFTEEKMKLIQLQEERAQTVRLVPREDETCESDDHLDPPRIHKRSSRGSASDSGFESDADTNSILSSGMQTPQSNHHHHPRIGSSLEHRIDPRYVPSRGSALSQQSTAFSRNEGVAWATVEKLRNENADLKMQLVDLQRGYDGVLEFVDGLSNK